MAIFGVTDASRTPAAGAVPPLPLCTELADPLRVGAGHRASHRDLPHLLDAPLGGVSEASSPRLPAPGPKRLMRPEHPQPALFFRYLAAPSSLSSAESEH